MAKKSAMTLSSTMLVALIVAIIGLAWGIYRIMPQPADIFVVDMASLPEGHTVVKGLLQKNTPVGTDGDFFLSTDSGDVIALDRGDLDAMNNLQVEVEGTLRYADTGTPYMLVEAVTLTQ